MLFTARTREKEKKGGETGEGAAPFDYFAIYQFINSTIVCAPHVRHSLWQSQLVAHAKYVSIKMPLDLPPATWLRFVCTTLHQVNDISV